MVTAELAIGILSAAMVAITICWGLHVIAVQTECADAASQIARAEARADSAAAKQARGHVPDGAAVDVEKTGTQVNVTVSVPVSLGHLLTITATGRATMPKEPGK